MDRDEQIKAEGSKLALLMMEAYGITCQMTGTRPVAGADALLGVIATTIVQRDVEVVEAIARKFGGFSVTVIE